MTKYKLTDEDFELFTTYVNLCNDEYGDYCRALLELLHACESTNSTFDKQVSTQILKELNNFKRNAKIEIEEEVITRRTEKLIWRL